MSGIPNSGGLPQLQMEQLAWQLAMNPHAFQAAVNAMAPQPPVAAAAAAVPVVAGTKHALPQEEQPTKRQKLEQMPPLQTASGGVPSAANIAASGAAPMETSGTSTSAATSNGTNAGSGKHHSSDPLGSPAASPPAGTDAFGHNWNVPLVQETVDAAVATAKAHLEKLKAWKESEEEELRFLQSILAPGSTANYLDYAKPYTPSFAVLDAATPIPALSAAPVAQSSQTGGSRLSRAAGAQHAQAGGVGVIDATGPSLEELEKQRAVLAAKIKLFTADSGRKLDKSLEPPRNKTHWDYLLEEMAWMAADFQRERKWKSNLAKKISRNVLNHHKKGIDKEFKQLKDEVMQRRKRAAWVSREIKKFWSNIGKLVKHKHQTIVEEEKKKAMDRHLEILVDQTETFSSKLAADLQGKGVGKAVKAAEAAQLAAANAAVAGSSASAAAASSSASSSAPSPDAEESANTDNIDVGKVDDILSSLKGPKTADARRSTRVHKPSAAPSSSAGAPTDKPAADDKEDGDFGEEESEEDEEGTLSEEEEAEAAEGGISKRDAAKAEVDKLNEEAEMSIEELRAKYAAMDDDEEQEEAEEDGDESMEDAGSSSSVAAPASSATPVGSASSAAPSTSHFSDREDAGGAGEGGDEDEEMGEGGEGESEESDAEDDTPQKDEPKTQTTMLLEKAGAVTEEQRVTVASNLAAQAAPTGTTYKDQKVKTKVPFLIKGPAPLREYQHIGLDWLVSMYDNGLNGILADEMGLGKTLQCIALLAHLAVEKGVWGQHLIVVPTSVIVNWEMEFKRWYPACKVLTYHGSAKERKNKRRGWSDPNSFHVVITSYQLVLQDAVIFKRKKWHCLILDEAHNIKNFKSQRWQTLMHFRTHRRLLLTGTPLQNSVMELWGLLHFLMPYIFQSQAEFKNWFSNPVAAMVEGKDAVDQKLLNRLHGILRPFLLRRLKTAVAQQLPKKFEHTVMCKMSKRQRYLYEDFMAASDTQKTLASGNFMGMMNVVMSLRKVVNHPDLFSGRAIISPFDQMEPLAIHVPSKILGICQTEEDERRVVHGLDLHARRLLIIAHQMKMTAKWEAERVHQLATPAEIIQTITDAQRGPDSFEDDKHPIPAIAQAHVNALRQQRTNWRISRRAHMASLNAIRTQTADFAVFHENMIRLVQVPSKLAALDTSPRRFTQPNGFLTPAVQLVTTNAQRADELEETIKRVCCIIPRARAKPQRIYVNKPNRSKVAQAETDYLRLLTALSPMTDIYRTSFARQQIFFPDKFLLQFDCGKLQKLAVLLRERKAGGHRVLIFSQFSKMLDILEAFLSMHGYKYLRLDGATKTEDRGRLMERFNRDEKVFCFILSTRSGGIGINLTGADSVVMYDSDWNPAADLQAQDRAHRLGQCWGQGTRLMLADGSSKKVEHLLTTDVLMGDDGTPRHIQKLIRGHTGEDADKVRNVVPSLPPLKKEFMRDGGAGRPRTAEGKYYCKFQGCNFTTDKKNTIGGHETRHPEIPPPPMPGMYRISPSVGGLDSWTCNGSHVLVLRWNHRPSSVRFATNTEKTGTISRPWRFWAFEHRDNLVVMGFQCFESKEEAEQAQATATANFQPLEVEMSVDDFLSCASYVRESAVMFQPSGPLPFRSTGVSLQQHLQRTLGDEVSPELLAETAWVLGAYLTSGVGGEIAVPSGERAAVFKDRFRRWRDSTIMPYTGDESTPAGQESWCSFFGREPAGCQAEMQSSSSSAGSSAGSTPVSTPTSSRRSSFSLGREESKSLLDDDEVMIAPPPAPTPAAAAAAPSSSSSAAASSAPAVSRSQEDGKSTPLDDDVVMDTANVATLLVQNWCDARVPYPTFVALVKGRSSQLCTIDITHIGVDPSSKSSHAVVYYWCVEVLDFVAYFQWLAIVIANEADGTAERRIRRCVDVAKYAQKQGGRFCYYFGETVTVLTRYTTQLSATAHALHASTSHPSFRFHFRVLAAQDNVANARHNKRASLRMEGEVGALLGITEESLGTHVLNAAPLGVRYSCSFSDEVMATGELLSLLVEHLQLDNEDVAIPRALLSESIPVRQALAAGILDTRGHISVTDQAINLSHSSEVHLETVCHLLRGLGCDVGRVSQASDSSRGYTMRVNLGGHLSALPTRLPGRDIPLPKANPLKPYAAFCFGFKVNKVAHAPYYGLELDGNRRCLMDDFTVTHNSREVNVYRLITERSIEENILKKSNQKREMNNVVIGDGNFNTDFLEKLDPRELLGLAPKKAASSGVHIEEMKDGDEDAKASKALAAAELQAQIEKQREEMLALEDDADRAALQQSVLESQEDLDDFQAGEVGEKVKERVAAAAPASRKPNPAVTAIKSMGKIGVLRGKQSTSSVPAVAAFENALTPVQRYALHFSEFIDPLITAQQMRATQRQIELEEAKWKAKQGGLAAGAVPIASPTGFPVGDAMDTSSDEKTTTTVVKQEPTDGGAAGGPTVKQEPTDGGGSGHPAVPSGGAAAVSSPNPSPSSDSKNVLAGSRPSTYSHLEDKYLQDQLFREHASLLHQLSVLPVDAPSMYEYPFQQPEYQWQQHLLESTQKHQQAKAAEFEKQQEANKAAGLPVLPTPVVEPPKYHQVVFGSLPTNALINHPYFNAQQRKAWQYRAFRSVLRTMASRGFRESQPFALREGLNSPTPDDVVSQQEDDADGASYGLFATPDSISRMLGPKLHHPERQKVAAKARGDVKSHSAHPLSHRRRVVGPEGGVRIAYVSSDDSDPVSIRIPWLKLKSGGIDRSFLVLSRAGVDYPAKTTAHRLAQQQQVQPMPYQTQMATTIQEEQQRAKQRIQYEGLKLDGILPFTAGIQVRSLGPNTLVLPTPKRPVASSAAAKALPPAAAGAASAASAAGGVAAPADAGQQQQAQVTPSKRQRDGLFGVRQSTQTTRLRQTLVDETVSRERFLNWNPDEDAILLACVNEYGANWSLIAQMLQTTPRLAGRLRSTKEVQNRYAWLQHKKNGGADMPAQQMPQQQQQLQQKSAVPGAGGVPGQPGMPGGQPGVPGSMAAPASGVPAGSAAAAEEEKKKRLKDKDGKPIVDKTKLLAPTPLTGDKKLDPLASQAAAAAAQKSKSKPGSAPGTTFGFGSKQLVVYVDRATKQIKVEQQTARQQLRTFFQQQQIPLDEPNQKPGMSVQMHPSHTGVLLEAHNRLALPQLAMGKTLMPHQLIQLRMRRQQNRMNQQVDEKGRMIGHGHGPPPGSSSQQQQQQQGSQRGPDASQGQQGMNPQQQGSSSSRNYNNNPSGGGPNMQMAPPSNQRLQSMPNTGGNNPAQMQQGGGSSSRQSTGGNMQGGGNQQYSGSGQQRSSGSSGNQQQYNSSSGGSGNQGGNYQGSGGGGGGSNYNSSSSNQQYSQSGYNQAAGGSSGNYSGSSSSGGPPMQRYQSAPGGGGSSKSGSNQQGGSYNTGSSGQYNSSSGGGSSRGGGGSSNYNNASGGGNYNSNQSGGGAGSSNYYPSNSGNTSGTGNYNPSVSPPPGSSATLLPPSSSSSSGGQGQSSASRSKSPSMSNASGQGNYPSGGGGGGGGVNMMNASGAPTPNIPPANTSYYNTNSSSSGGGSSGGGGNYGSNYPSSSGGGNYSGGSGGNQYSSSSNRGSSGSNYSGNAGSISSSYNSNYNTNASNVGTSQPDEESLTQLLTWVSINMPKLLKASQAIYSEKSRSSKERFDAITQMLSRGTG